jgi:hypothetical protein
MQQPCFCFVLALILITSQDLFTAWRSPKNPGLVRNIKHIFHHAEFARHQDVLLENTARSDSDDVSPF